jgi:hypothetical protein
VTGLIIEEAKYHRYDPRPYLKNLVRDLDTLLSAIREWNIVLSGSRVSAFFYPSASTKNSDWDFYYISGTLTTSIFSITLQKMGAEWETSQRESKDITTYNGNFLVL